MAATPSRPRRSSRLASATPSAPETARAPTRAQTSKTAAAFDPSTAMTRLLRGDRAAVPRLTKAQLEALVHSLADRDAESQERITHLEHNLQRTKEQRDSFVMKRSTQEMKMSEIMRKHYEKKAAEEKVEAATQTADLLPPPAPQTDSALSLRPVTPPDAIMPSPAAPNSTSLWGSAIKFITPSFFSKKRRAEDEPASEEPAQKRQKPTEPAPTAPQPPPTNKRQKPSEPAATAIEQPTTKSASATTEQTPTRPTPAAVEPPATAPPRASFFDQPTTTPAKTPKRKRTTATLASATPLPAISEASPKEMNGINTITPRPRRTIANTRLTQSTRKAPQSTQPERRYVWESKPPQAKEPNADARIAKIRRAEALRRELKELEEEEKLLKRTKRVKVDHLTEIPHNRPGDSSSTFRVPDIDSDDEMEVFDEVEERGNIFSTSQQPPAPAQQPSMPLPPKQPATATNTQQATTPLPRPPSLPAQQATMPLPPASAPVVAVEQQQQQAPQLAPLRFVFPSVAPRPDDYHVTEEYKKAAGDIFAAGLAAFTAST